MSVHALTCVPEVESLSLYQKAAQLLAYAIWPSHPLEPERPNRVEQFVARYGIGSIHFTTGNPQQVVGWREHLQRLAVDAVGAPILFGADCEQGLPHSFECGTEMPWQLAIGATGDPAFARRAGAVIGRESRALGLDMVYGPCADVNSNPQNRLLVSRAFGCDAERVADFVRAYVEGMEAEGVTATLKHFPGHGGAEEDSHLELAWDPSPRDAIEAIHLPPFAAGIAAGAGAIMTGHVVLPALDPERPATLSRPWLTDVLRHRLGFEGVLITDSMNMHSVRKDMSMPTARLVVEAVLAGADIVLHPRKLNRALDAIVAAVESGEISLERLDQSVRRVLALKQTRLPWQQRTPSDPAPALAGEAHRAVAREIAERSVTLVSGPECVLPDPPVRVLVVIDDGGNPLDVSSAFQDRLLDARPGSQSLVVREREPASRALAGDLKGPVVLAVMCPMMWFKGRTLLSEDLAEWIRTALRDADVLATVVFGSPHILDSLPGATGLCAYGPSEPSLRAAADVLLGRLTAGRDRPF